VSQLGDLLSREHLVAWLGRSADAIRSQRDELNALDAAIGDADHGTNLDRGLSAVAAALPGLIDRDIGTVLRRAGMTLVSTVGGASGPLYGSFFLQAGSVCIGKLELTPIEWLAAFQAGVDGVVARGHASAGDKTMLDALLPAASALRSALGDDMTLTAGLQNAAGAAKRGAEATIPLIARKGRASYLGERSIGHQDPGATSAAGLVGQLASVVRDLTP
jgi:dihydroxyacetone kinase-like protein